MPCPIKLPEPEEEEGSGPFHVIPTWEPHEPNEDCRCGPQRNWFQNVYGDWDFIVVHFLGH